MRRLLALVSTTFVIAACQTPQVPTIASVQLVPQAGEEVKVDHLLLIFDASGSVDRRTLFPRQKALAEAFVGSLPDGDFTAGQIAFGGDRRRVTRQAPFERLQLLNDTRSVVFLDKDTQLDRVLLEAQDTLAGRDGLAAIVVFSDGGPTAPDGWRPGPAYALEAARVLAASRQGETCFYAVHSGRDAEGKEFMRALTKVTDCGAYRQGDDLLDIASLHSFEREIFLGEALPPVAAMPVAQEIALDSDADGVLDDADRCGETLTGATVNSDGCFIAPTIYFESDGGTIPDADLAQLISIGQILEKNPAATLRVDGYADSSGSSGYNLKLSERRANAAQAYLLSQGIASERIEARGMGEVAAGDAADMTKDRRIEFYFTK